MQSMGMTTREDEQRLQLELLIGGKYEVLRRLGGGGMAQVLLARHRGHGGLVAIKILADRFSQDPRIVSRFRQEATTAASLSGHPNIVPIYDIGEGNGLHYLIMQFIGGEDMGSYLQREGRLSPPDAAGVVTQACEGLVWAETRRIVHRDLKPSNLQLDVSGRIHILDFGISKTADLADGLTRPGESLGTPYYMSPEQIRGEVCDGRSDLYSLGVIFFELLTGKRPFDNESVTAIQIAHLSAPPPSVLDVAPELPPMCDEIVQKLLKKERSERYQSPQELLDDLYRHGATSGPTSLRPVIDANLQAEIDRPAGLTIQAANGSEPLTTILPTPPPIVSSAARSNPIGSVAAAAPEISIAPPRRSPVLKIALAGVAVVVILAAGLVFYLRPKPLAPVLDDAHGRMLLVPEGKFVFGDDAADSHNQQQTINLPAFYIDRTEVSNAEYSRFVEATHRAFSGSVYATGHPDEPVTSVSAADAAAYAIWAGKRLPTEQEWEKAARGTDGRPFPWGIDPWTQNVPQQLQPVDSFPDRKSPYGALNMAGNAWEWTATRYMPGELELADMRHVLKSDAFSKTWYCYKGGSFSPNGSLFFRVYLTRGAPEDQLSKMVGFRCAKDASAVSK
jgi:serine/threonine protein kinase